MASSYPGSLDSFTTKIDGIDWVLASHMNEVQSSIVATQTELGTDVAGSMPDLKTRLAVSLDNDGTLADQVAIGGAVSGNYALTVRQTIADNSGIIVFGYDDKSAETLGLYHHGTIIDVDPAFDIVSSEDLRLGGDGTTQLVLSDGTASFVQGYSTPVDVAIGGSLNITSGGPVVQSYFNVSSDTITAYSPMTTDKVIVDKTDTEALLVRQDTDTGDVFIVDTTNKEVEIYDRLGIYGSPNTSYGLSIYQAGDNEGMAIWGYDDKSTTWIRMRVRSDGFGEIDADQGLNIESNSDNLTLASAGYINLDSASSIYNDLGDNAGAEFFYVRDSDNWVQWKVSSDGDVTSVGRNRIYQHADDDGLTLYGYDDMVGEYLDIRMASDGDSILSASRAFEVYTANGENISLVSDNNISLRLGDAAGADKFLVYDNAWSLVSSINSDGFLYTKQKLGIGTNVVPHGSVGGGRLAIEGTDGNLANGPHVQITTASDNYPLMQFLNWSHDNISIIFDGYYDGSWRSSDAGSNFKITKLSDRLRIDAESGISAGSLATYVWAFSVESDATTRVQKSLYINERSAALGDVAGYGQYWVKNDTPNRPKFTDDAGTDLWLPVSDGTTGGSGSAGSGNQYIEIEINGSTYKVLHDGTV